MGDWYVIERAEHDGRMWLESTGPNSMALRCSSRFSDADVEGTGAEMRAIAKAILEHGVASFRRCAVDARGDIALFWSPRNSQTRGMTHIAYAAELANQILREVPEKEEAADAAG